MAKQRRRSYIDGARLLAASCNEQITSADHWTIRTGRSDNLFPKLFGREESQVFIWTPTTCSKFIKRFLKRGAFRLTHIGSAVRFFSAFETVALAACWKLFTDKNDSGAAFLAVLLACLGVAMTLVWFLMNNRTHQYARYWLESVGEVEARLMERSNESGVDFARKILDDRRSTIPKSVITHRGLERAVPLLFVLAWIALFLWGTGHLPLTRCVDMHGLLSYESITLAIAIASLLVSTAAVWIARSTLFQAKQVADRERKDWIQRKWFDLYFKADEAYDALDRFQALYPSPSSPDWNTEKMQMESHELMRTMRTVHRIALVFPQNPIIQALFDATAAFKNMEEATSKDRLSKVFDAVQGIRQKALLDMSVLD